MIGMPRLVIDQQLAEIGVKVTPAQMRITNPRQKMKIVQEAPKMAIERKEAEFQFDRQKVMNESGLLSQKEFSRRNASQGKQGAMRATAKIAREGDQLANLTQPGNRMAQIARQNSMTRAKKDLNIGLMPKSMPDIEWSPGSMKVNWSDHKFKIEWSGEYMPETVIDPRYSVEVFLRTRPHFRISVVEGESLSHVGRNVDEML